MSENDQDRGPAVPSWQIPQGRQPETDAYHIWTSRPLLRSVYWKPVPAPPHELVSSSYEVFVDQRAWLAMHNHVWGTPTARVPFGYLIGDLCEDPNANRRFVIITGSVPARFDFDEEAPDQISREAGLALRLEVDRHRGTLVGWYHRHLGGAVALSEQDLVTHGERFAEPWHCAFLFVGDGSDSKGGCFRSTSAGVSSDLPFPFYEMASNESLLPRGIKRSYLDWDNYATVDEIRSEPPKRPELVVPIPEPSVPAAEPSPTQTIETDVVSDVVTEVEFEKEPGADAELHLGSYIDLEPDPEPEAESESQAEVDSELEAEPESEVTSEAAEEPEADAESSVDWDLDVLREEAEEKPESTETDLLDVEFDAGLFEPEAFDFQLDEMAEEVTDIVPELVTESEPGPILQSVSGEGVHEDPISEEPPIASETLPVSEDRDAEKFEYESGRPARKPSRRFLGLVVGFEGGSKNRRRMAALAIGGLVVASAVVAGLVSIAGGGSTGPKGGIDQATGGTSSQGESDPPIEMPAVASGDSIRDGPVTREQIEDQSQEMLATISRFYGSVVGMDDGTATCADLRAAFVIVEDGWIEYNSRFKAGFPGQLPDDLAARDERLYLGVQDVEREFERSGCPRP